MALSVSRWAWAVRGLTPSEHHVLLLLADQADADGHISKLSHQTIQARCGFSRVSRYSQKVLRTLQQKGFVSEVTARWGARGNQISNAYQLDLARLHPDDTHGPALWRAGRDYLAQQRNGQLRTKVELHAEGSTAYYRPDDAVLLVWLSNRYARQFFFDHLGDLVRGTAGLRPEPSDLELLLGLPES